MSGESPRGRRELHGAAASPGVAVGSALVWRRSVLPVDAPPSGSPAGPDAEIARLRSALATARGELEALRDKAPKDAGESEAEIFSAQLLMLDDPLLIGQAEDDLRAKGVSAEEALARAGRQAAEAIEAIASAGRERRPGRRSAWPPRVSCGRL